MLGEHVHDSNIASPLGQSTDAVTVNINPPRVKESFRIFSPVRVGRNWRHVQESSLRAEELFTASGRIDESLRLQQNKS